MSRALRHGWASIVLAIMLVVAGVQYASHSVRSEVTEPDLAAFLAVGGSLDDLCLSEDHAHDHADCPFCRELELLALEPHAGAARPHIAMAAVGCTDRQTNDASVDAALRPPARAPPAA